MREGAGIPWLDGLWVGLAAFTMGTFVAVAHYAAYGPILPLGVGETILTVPLLVGIALGLLFHRVEPAALVLRGFVACAGAIVLIVVTLYAPVLAGITPSLADLGSEDAARLASVFTSLFILPVHLLGNVVGRGIAEVFPPAARTSA